MGLPTGSPLFLWLGTACCAPTNKETIPYRARRDGWRKAGAAESLFLCQGSTMIPCRKLAHPPACGSIAFRRAGRGGCASRHPAGLHRHLRATGWAAWGTRFHQPDRSTPWPAAASSSRRVLPGAADPARPRHPPYRIGAVGARCPRQLQFQPSRRGPTLAERLSAAGYDTAPSSAPTFLASSFGLGRGFARYDELPLEALKSGTIAVPERRAEVTIAAAGEWLGRRSQNPFFAWVHLYDPHAPYEPPAPWRGSTRILTTRGGIRRCQARRPLAKDPPSGAHLDRRCFDHGEGLEITGRRRTGHFFTPPPCASSAFSFLPPGRGPRVGTAGRSGWPTSPQPSCRWPEPSLFTVPVATFGFVFPSRSAAMETLYPWFHHGLSPLRGLSDAAGGTSSPRGELYDMEGDPGQRRNLAGERTAKPARMKATLARVFADEGGAKPAAPSPGAVDDPSFPSDISPEGSRAAAHGRWKDLPDPKDRRDYLAAWSGTGPDRAGKRPGRPTRPWNRSGEAPQGRGTF